MPENKGLLFSDMHFNSDILFEHDEAKHVQNVRIRPC